MVLMLPARDAEQFIFSAGDLWDFRHATYWLERPAIDLLDIQWLRMESQTKELPVPKPDIEEIQDHIRNTRSLIDETLDPSDRGKLYLQLCQWLERRNAIGPALDAALEGLQELGDEISETRVELEYETGSLLERKDQFADAARHLKMSLKLNENNPWGEPKNKAKCLEKFGNVQKLMANFSGAKSSYVTALTIHRESGNRLGEANCLSNIGFIQMSVSDFSGAKSSYGTAFNIYREIGNRLGKVNCLTSLGDLQMRMFDLSGAKSSYGAALPIYREIGARLGEANCLRSLGDLQMRMSDLFGAKSSYRLALPIYREIGDRLGEANCLWCLGDLEKQMSDFSAAKSSNSAALLIYREIGERLGEAKCLWSIGDLHMLMSDFSLAKSSLSAALSIYREIGDGLGEANSLESEGLLRLVKGESAGAFRKFREVLKFHEDSQNYVGQQAALGYLARAAKASKAADQALLLAEASLIIGRQIKDRWGQALNLQLQQKIWQNAWEEKPFLATRVILRKLRPKKGNPEEATYYTAVIEQLQSQLPGETVQALETDPESIRAAAIAEARERFAQTGRDLFDPPPEPE
jgi:tetratricopeptide (TPR) repeat protein